MRKLTISVLAAALLAVMPVNAEISRKNLLRNATKENVSILLQNNNIQRQSDNKVKEESINKLKAAARRAPVTKTAPNTLNVVLLDSVISENRKEYYRYNNHGWLQSKEVYNLEGNNFVLDTEESFRGEYEFDAMDRIVSYNYYEYNEDGSAYVSEKMTSTWTGAKAHIEKYYSTSEYDEWEGLQLVSEYGYDEFGNISIMKEYEWDYEKNVMELDEVLIAEFTRNVMEYYYTEEGYYDGMDYNEDLLYRYMTCYIEADNYELYGEKYDTKVDGLTTTKTLYTADKYFDDEQDIEKLIADIDSYWEYAEEEIITLTPKGNRFASIYYYSAPWEEDMPSYDDQPSYDEEVEAIPTRSQTNRVLESSYVMEYDELDRLTKCVNQGYDDDGSIYTHTYKYRNDKTYNYTIEELMDALYEYWDNEGEGEGPLSGYFYGEVSNEHVDVGYGYADKTIDEYDANGNILHLLVTEHYYSESEMGQDENGDGILSTESRSYSGEFWYTYNSNNKQISEIFYDHSEESDYAYYKTDNIANMTDDGYLEGWSEYEATAKNGPWILVYESYDLYSDNVYEAYDVRHYASWWRQYNREEDYWYGRKYVYQDGYEISYEIDPTTGEFIVPENTANGTVATRSGFAMYPGDNYISFVEDNWQYEGYIKCDYIFNEEDSTEVLKVMGGHLSIHWIGSSNGKYEYDHPSNNYNFPVGPIYFGIDVAEDVIVDMGFIELYWDEEMEQWINHFNNLTTKTSHSKDSQGNITEISRTYRFNQKTERMEVVSETITKYVFDEYKRLAYITDNSSTTFFNYLSKDSNYLLESYTVDGAGNKYNVCKYYYSNGEYSFPYTEVKDIDADTEWSIDGLTITANGTITLYNLNGVKVATENDILQAPEAGIYIMDINGKRTKINIR